MACSSGEPGLTPVLALTYVSGKQQPHLWWGPRTPHPSLPSVPCWGYREHLEPAAGAGWPAGLRTTVGTLQQGCGTTTTII